MERFRVGFSPGAVEMLAFLEANNISYEQIVATGNLMNEKDGLVDRFTYRLVFPIFDLVGNVCGFSGRVLPGEDGSKYTNSPSSYTFKKSLALFGLYQALETIKTQNFALVVEGNVDVMMASQAGVLNTVAACGTALREEHLAVLKHYTNNIVLCFDVDDAGRRATEKAEKLCKAAGLQVWVAHIPSAKDPAEFVLNYGPEAFLDAIYELFS
jgi:DNA primase